jgi:hypothetical protein
MSLYPLFESLCHRASLEESFPVRPQVELESPSRAILFDQSPIDFSNGCRIHERFVGLLFNTQVDLPFANYAINNYMRNMDTARPELSR